MKRAVSLCLLLALVTIAFAAKRSAPTRASATQTYLVLYKAQAVTADAASVIANAGGTQAYRYNEIGVAIARFDSAAFHANLLQDRRVEGALSTSGFGIQLQEEEDIYFGTLP